MWGQSTGVAALDYLTGGLHDEDYTILAGRPSMGKSALAMQIAYHRAREYRRLGEDKRVVVFSAEMAGWQVVLREAARLARISSTQIKRGELTAEELEFVKGIIRDLRQYPLVLDDTHGASGDQITDKLRKLRDSGPPIGLVVFDHIHLGGGEGEYGRISALSTTLKRAASKLHVPVLALAQLNREVDKREVPIPVLSDLRGAGSLEQDIDNGWFVYRARKYDLSLDQNEPHEAQILVEKARNHGEVGSANTVFVPRYTEFRNAEEA